MMRGEVCFRDPATLRDYVLLPQGEEPFGWGAYDAIDTRAAISMLVAVISSHPEHPHWELLHALEIVEHPYNIDLSDLQVMVANGLARGLGLQLLCRRAELGSTSLRTKRLLAPETDGASSGAASLDYIGISIRSASGVPIQGQRVELWLPDGSICTVVSDHIGQVRADGISPGTCSIVLPEIDGSRWKSSAGAVSIVRRDAPVTHVVRQGECLSKIAHARGAEGWEQVWNESANADLRATRKSPHVLLPGDRVMIPGIRIGKLERPTGQTHELTVSMPKNKLVAVRMRLESRWKKALEGLEYTVSFELDGEFVSRPGSAPTNSSGLIEEMIPSQVEAVVIAFCRPKVCFKLLVSQLEPTLESKNGRVVATGVLARLRALGFDARGNDGGRAAIAHLQRAELARSDPTGDLDQETIDKLEQLYGV